MADKSRLSLPGAHQWVKTEDGSYTLFSERFQEACHSSTGAKTETIVHYIKGCKVAEKIQSEDSLTILEVGFGLGLGFLTTYESLKSAQKGWTFISLELDEELLHWTLLEYAKHSVLGRLEWVLENGFRRLEAKDEFCHLIILAGNARETLPHFMKNNSLKWSAIYQDAFSPKKNPILWTTEWFSLLKTGSTDEVILSTYSASSSIRKSLLEAGFCLHKGEPFGPKRSSTRATLNGISDPDILLQLERSPTQSLKD